MKILRTIIILLLILVLVFSLQSRNGDSGDIGIQSIFNRLSPEEQREALEAELMDAIADYRTVIELRGYSSELVVDTFKDIVDSHPEFFWLSGGYKYTVSRTAYIFKTITMKPDFIVSSDEVPALDKTFQQAVKDVIGGIDANASDFDKALFAHDYITANCSYDMELYTAIQDDGVDPTSINRLGTTAYGCLVDNKAVCSGYTCAFQLLMNGFGIPCGKVSGTAGDGETIDSHVWNYITLDGKDYYVDVTWDDPSKDGSDAPPDHSYFCVTGEELLKSHSIDEGETAPICSATEYNYHVHRNVYIGDYDFNTLAALVTGSGVTEIKFSSADELQRACTDLFDGNRVFAVPYFAAHGYCTVWYRSCTDSCVLTLWVE